MERREAVGVGKTFMMSQPEEAVAAGVVNALALIADEAIIVCDEATGICFFNQGAERIFGFRASEVRGRPLDVLLPERFRVAHRDHVRRFAGAEEVARPMGRRAMIFGLRSNGQEFPAEASIAKFVVGERRYFGVILRDVTAMVEARREIERLKGLLPVCAYCRKVRDDSGYWQDVESYLKSHSNLLITHGICKECLAKELQKVAAGAEDEPRTV